MNDHIVNVLRIHPEASDAKLIKRIRDHNELLDKLRQAEAEDLDRTAMIRECTAAEIAGRKRQHFYGAYDRLKELARLAGQAEGLYKKLLIEARSRRDEAEKRLSDAEASATKALAKVGISPSTMQAAGIDEQASLIQFRNTHLIRTEMFRQARSAVEQAEAAISAISGYLREIATAENAIQGELARGFDRL